MCSGRWNHCCTVCCVKVVSLSSCLIALSGISILLLTLLLIAFDTVSTGKFDFGGIINFTQIEIVMGLSGLFLIASCCIGNRFVRSKSRLTGCLYLALLIVGISAQVYAFANNVLSQRNLQIVSQLTSMDLNETLTDDMAKYLSDSHKRGMQRAWSNFADSSSKYQCSIGGGGEVPAALSNYRDIGEIVNFARVLSEGEDVMTKCKVTEREVLCTENAQYGNLQGAMCMGGTGDAATKWKDDCTGCQQNYLKLWLTDDMTEKAKEDITALFDGQVGTMFCRCLSSWIQATGNYETIIFWVTFVYIVFLLLLLFSVVWMICCGTEKKPDDEEELDDAEGQLTEMEGNPRRTEYDQQQQEDLVAVACPPDSYPGSVVTITNPRTGNQSTVQVPEGVYPGMLFQVWV